MIGQNPAVKVLEQYFNEHQRLVDVPISDDVHAQFSVLLVDPSGTKDWAFVLKGGWVNVDQPSTAQILMPQISVTITGALTFDNSTDCEEFVLMARWVSEMHEQLIEKMGDLTPAVNDWYRS